QHRKQAEELIAGTAQYYFLQAKATPDVRARLQMLAKALELDGQHYDSLRERAYIYYAQQDYEQMARDAARMIGIQPNNPRGYSLSAIAWRELGRLEEALQDHAEAIRLAPNEPELYASRWQTYTRMGRYESALPDIQECVQLRPDDILYSPQLVLTLIAMARYDEANREYNRYVSRPALDRGFGVNVIGREGKVLFVALSMEVALDSLVSGRPVYPPDHPRHGAAYYGVHVAERCYEKLSRQARRIVSKGFHPSWSPDGTKLVYTMGLLRSNAVAVLDLETGRTDLLTMPGKDPEWSSDGRHIAFVRDRSLLPLDRLIGLTAQTWQTGYGPSHVEEVWVIDMTSRRLWRIARGGYPHWGHKSNRLYYTSRQDHTLYSVSV
ncbi:MAG: PD40 domain-containing protein, partial [Phycisphaerales bacterium]